MSTANPYAPPGARVADVDDYGGGTEPVKTWSAQGRIGRLRYIAHLVGASLVLMLVMFVVGFVAAMAGSELLTNIGMFVTYVAYLWFFILKTIQRSHDMDWNGWTSVLAIIPFVGLIWWFKGGTAGANRFGRPAPPNTTGVRILAFALPVIFVIGILAAIALPAYKGYTDRAKAVQQR